MSGNIERKAEDAFKVSLVDKSQVPKARSRYDWETYWSKIEIRPDWVLKLENIPRSTVRQAVKRYNVTHAYKLRVITRRAEVYVCFVEVPKITQRPSFPGI